jgi:hypothetical protein
MKPLLQLFGLVLNEIWLSQKPPKRGKIAQFEKEVEEIRQTELDEKKCEEKITKLKDKEVKELLFSMYLRDANNKKLGNQSMLTFFKSLKK